MDSQLSSLRLLLAWDVIGDQMTAVVKNFLVQVNCLEK